MQGTRADAGKRVIWVALLNLGVFFFFGASLGISFGIPPGSAMDRQKRAIGRADACDMI